MKNLDGHEASGPVIQLFIQSREVISVIQPKTLSMAGVGSGRQALGKLLMVFPNLQESWLDLDSDRLTAEASRDWSIMPMFTLCL